MHVFHKYIAAIPNTPASTSEEPSGIMPYMNAVIICKIIIAERILAILNLVNILGLLVIFQ